MPAISHRLKIGPCIHTTRPSVLRRRKGSFFYFVHGSSIKDMPTHSDRRESTCCRLRNLLQPPIPLHFQERAHSRRTQAHTHTRTHKLSALIHFFENRHLAEPYPPICKYNPGCAHRHKNRRRHLRAFESFHFTCLSLSRQD